MPSQLFSIGYSSHDIGSFLNLLKLHNITAVADVRSVPYSRFAPQFNRDLIPIALKAEAIEYVFLGKELGARRENPNCYVNGKAIYELIENDDSFRHGIKRLMKGVEKFQIALMCSEKDPIFCHRAILVSKNLVKENLAVDHIHSDGKIESHAQLEERMLELFNRGSNDLLLSRADRIREAYRLQGERVAFQDHSIDANENRTTKA